MFKPELSDEENFKLYGKCSNPNWHGHNYELWVTIKGELDPMIGYLVDLKDLSNILKVNVIDKVDHKNLNTDVEHFKKANPTVENIAEFAFKSLSDKLKPMELDCITVWENDRTFCTFRE